MVCFNGVYRKNILSDNYIRQGVPLENYIYKTLTHMLPIGHYGLSSAVQMVAFLFSADFWAMLTI